MIVEFRSVAREELLEAGQRYLDDGGPANAERLEDAIRRAPKVLALMPALGSPRYPQVRL